jgi:hypothetical protein
MYPVVTSLPSSIVKQGHSLVDMVGAQAPSHDMYEQHDRFNWDYDHDLHVVTEEGPGFEQDMHISQQLPKSFTSGNFDSESLPIRTKTTAKTKAQWKRKHKEGELDNKEWEENFAKKILDDNALHLRVLRYEVYHYILRVVTS